MSKRSKHQPQTERAAYTWLSFVVLWVLLFGAAVAISIFWLGLKSGFVYLICAAVSFCVVCLLMRIHFFRSLGDMVVAFFAFLIDLF